MGIITAPTRTTDTIKQYRIRAKQLLNAFMHDLSVTHPRHIKTSAFGTWMLERSVTLSPSAWRQYRSAVLCYAETSKILIHDELQQILNSHREDSTGGAKMSRQQRAKSLKERELLLIRDYFNSKIRCHDSHRMTFAFFMASIATGLRPCEWKYARLEMTDDRAKLIVRNAKSTNGRSHGIQRTIHIPVSEKSALHYIALTLAHIKKIDGHTTNQELFKKNYDTRIRTMRKQFSIMNNFLFPHYKKKIHLYSARHQASANLKRLGFTEVQLAALMGHASILTAGTHYGRKKSGKGGITTKVQPDSNDVARVEALNSNRAIKPHHIDGKESPIKIEGFKKRVDLLEMESDILSSPSTVKDKSPINFNQLKKKMAIEAEMEADDSQKNNGPSLC